MEMKIRRTKDESSLKRVLLEDYRRFRKLLLEKDITVNRLPWQPLVMFEKYWNQNRLFDLMKRLMDYPEQNINLAVELFSYKQYVGDTRYIKKHFAEIIESENDTLIFVFYPRSYNASSLTAEISRLEMSHVMTEGTREKIVKEVQAVFANKWPDYYMKFIPFGSQMYGLAFSNSPLNICIELDEPDIYGLIKSRDPMHDTYYPYCAETARDAFHRKGGDKFHFDPDIGSVRMKLNSFNVEYNFNKKIFTESTNLLHHYLSLDPRIKPLLYAIKIFGRGRNIFASQITNGVRYYGYVLMALAYLSQLDPPVIPNLQHLNQHTNDDDCYMPECRTKRAYWSTAIKEGAVGVAARYHDCVSYDPTQPHTHYFVAQNPNTGNLYWHSKNESSVGELLIDFFYYYGYEFDFRIYAVSLKFGGQTPLKSDWKADEIAIEDPFMAKSNIAAGTDGKKFQDVFRGSFSVLHSGTCFEQLHKKISDIVKYDSVRGMEGNRPSYTPMKRWKPHATSKSFLLIGLQKTDALHCYCTRIANLFSTHGKITSMLDLDGSTKQIFFTADTGNAMDIVLPSIFTLDGREVHLVELYEYSFTDSV